MAFEICIDSFTVVLCNYYSLLEDASTMCRSSIGISSVSCFVYELGVVTHPTLLFQWAVVPHPAVLVVGGKYAWYMGTINKPHPPIKKQVKVLWVGHCIGHVLHQECIKTGGLRKSVCM